MEATVKARKPIEGLRVATLFVLSLCVAMAMGAFVSAPAAYAENTIGGVHYKEGNNTYDYYFTSIQALNQELANHKGKNLTVEMAADWNARDTSEAHVDVDRCITIPSDTRVTFNMNGYMIDRGLSGRADDMSASAGEIFLVQSGATLTVNGGSSTEAKARSHNAYVYTSTESAQAGWVGYAAPLQKTFKGGLITGGNDKNGAGGIRMLKGSTVTLNDVTIAGCRNNNTNEGFGGGVRMDSGDTTLNMNNSTITGCFARSGGGIYVDNGGKATINLTNSHIDDNRVIRDGGGIYPGGKEVSIVGDGNSTISGNKCENNGGGVYAWTNKFNIQGVALRENSAFSGGGVYAQGDATTLQNLVIENNEASYSGGGVYITAAGAGSGYEGDSSIASCTVQGNSAAVFGGIYFDDYSNQKKERKRTISGTTIVKDNTVTSNDSISNLGIGTDDWAYKRESFSLAEGAEVWAGFHKDNGQTTSDDLKNSIVEDGKSEAYMHSEHAGLMFYFDLDTRSIVLISPSEIDPIPTAVKVNSANANNASGEGKTSAAQASVAGKVGTVGAGGKSGSDYNLVRGFFMHDNETNIALFYYSDGLFYGSPTMYNTHLGTLSWEWAWAGGYLNQTKPIDANNNTYYNKHASGRQFLADIGCPDQNIYINDSMTTRPGTGTIGVTIGSKELTKADGTKTGDILIPVAVRGQGYELEWVSNVTLDPAPTVDGAEARGFANAANEVYAEIQYYLKKYNLEDEYMAGKVKFWVVGYSRAGATANLTSKRLIDKIAEDGCASQVFGYTCEAAKGGTDLAEVPGSDYRSIHNMVNMVDLVPYVAPAAMGFKRYGVDHYVPGSAAGSPMSSTRTVTRGGEGGPGSVVTYADNIAVKTKTATYDSQKELMIRQLRALDSGVRFDDYFRPKALDFVQYKFPATLNKMVVYNCGNYDDNRAEDFVADFSDFLIEGPSKYSANNKGKVAPSRDAYAKDEYTLNGKAYPTIQTTLQDLMRAFMGSEGGSMSRFLDKAGNIKSNIPAFDLNLLSNDPEFSMAHLYFNVIGVWNDLSQKNREFYTSKLWNAFKKTNAIDELTAEDRARIEADFPTLINMALNFVDGDYNYKPGKGSDLSKAWAGGSNETMMYMPTLMQHASYILSCHMPEINVAWVRTYDSWFMDNEELNEYALIQPSSVATPKAYKIVNGKQQELEAGSQKENRMAGNQRIILENDEIVGEAVYYDLIDITEANYHVPMARNQIYRGGIDLSLGDSNGKKFLIRTYDMSYGVKSADVEYYMYLYKDNHAVTVMDLPSDRTPSLSGASASGADASSTPEAPRVTAQGASAHGADLVAGAIADDSPIQAAGADADSIAADYGGYREREFSFAENMEALVQAECPDTLFFKEWKVQSKTAYDFDVPGGTNVASRVFSPPETKGSASASFMMPNSGQNPFPAGYKLIFTAQYGERIDEISTLMAAPVEGRALSKELLVAYEDKTVSYPVAWSYKDGGKVVPVANDADVEHRAYKSTEYTAKVTIPQDTANGIAFAPEVVVNPDADTAVSPVQRNNADGSITVEISFPATGDREGAYRESATVDLYIETVDLNAPNNAPEKVVHYSAKPEQRVRVIAPDVSDELFVAWDLKDSGVGYVGQSQTGGEAFLRDKNISLVMPMQSQIPADGKLVVKATYVPVVKNVEVNLYDQDGNLFAPNGDESKVDRVEAFVEITNEYEINPDNLSVTWSPALPADGSFATMTEYVATVQIVPDSEGRVLAKLKGSADSAYQPVQLLFVPADDMAVEFNGSSANTALDVDNRKLSKVFPKTMYTLDAVKQPVNIEGVAYGTDAEGISALLPATTQVLATNGFEVDASIEWGTPEITEGADDPYASKVWTASGTVKLPGNFQNTNSVSLDVSITVTANEAEVALSPSIVLPSGTFLYDQTTTLITEEPDGTTYYTIDGTDPSNEDNPSRREYGEGEQIAIDREDAQIEDIGTSEEILEKKVVYIRACTVNDDKRPSAVTMSRYEFDDIPVPEGIDSVYDGNEHLGVVESPYYALQILNDDGSLQEADDQQEGGARIDDFGNVVATAPGTYRVKATLLISGDKWAATATTPSTSDPQIVTFMIAGEDEETCTIAASPAPNEGGTVEGDGTYAIDEEVELTATPAEGYAFVNWTENNKEAGEDEEVSANATYSFQAKKGRVLQANFARVLQVRWLDAEGIEIMHKDYREGEAEPTFDGVLPARESTVRYAFTFDGWEPLRSSDTVKTYAPRFSTTLNKYTVTFVDERGAELQGGQLEYGAMPAYEGDVPEKPNTAQHFYEFAGWDPVIGPVEGDVVYQAAYTESDAEYTVRFVDYDGDELQSSTMPYGAVPAYSAEGGQNPTRPATKAFTYEFAGWEPAIAAVTGEATYTAKYTATLNKYTIEFLGDEGEVLQSTLVEYGSKPEYVGDDPAKPDDWDRVYEWTGWQPKVIPVTGDATYRATFEAKDKYACTAGSGGKWTKGSNEALAFTFKRAKADETTYGHFAGIEVDGEIVPGEDASGNANYTAESGSVIVALQPTYLASLVEGEHAMTAIFDDGEAEAAFTVTSKAAPAPEPDPDPADPKPDEAKPSTKPAANSPDAAKPAASKAAQTGDSLAGLLSAAFALLVVSGVLLVASRAARRR